MPNSWRRGASFVQADADHFVGFEEGGDALLGAATLLRRARSEASKHPQVEVVALTLGLRPSDEMSIEPPSFPAVSQGEFEGPAGLYLLGSRESLMVWEGVEEYRVPLASWTTLFGVADVYYRCYRWDQDEARGWEFSRAIYVVAPRLPLPKSGRVARVRLLTRGEGGMAAAAKSGARAQLMIGHDLAPCTIAALDGRGSLEPGSDLLVTVRLQSPEQLATEFNAVKDVRLYDGSRLVGVGEFVDGELGAEAMAPLLNDDR